jgi:hypothetical protein
MRADFDAAQGALPLCADAHDAGGGRSSREVSDPLDELAQMLKPDLVNGFSDSIRQHAIASILGIVPTDKARFEQITPVIQQILEPWLPLCELKRVQDIFAEALSLMDAPSTVDSAPSLLGDLLAVALVLYSASFNLSHALVNSLHWVLTRPAEERRGIVQPDWIEHHLKELLALCSGPKYIHMITRHNLQTGELALTSGDTTRLVVQSLNHQTSAGTGHISCGQGLDRCIGAALSCGDIEGRFEVEIDPQADTLEVTTTWKKAKAEIPFRFPAHLSRQQPGFGCASCR